MPLRIDPRIAVTLLVVSQGAVANELTGTWCHTYNGPEGRSFAEVTLKQTGLTVTGTTVEDGSGGPRWEACLKGSTDGTRATVRVCYTNQGGSGTTIPTCPEYGPTENQFVWIEGGLMWFRRSSTKGRWAPYKTLKPVAKPPRRLLLTIAHSCGLTPRSSGAPTVGR